MGGTRRSLRTVLTLPVLAVLAAVALAAVALPACGGDSTFEDPVAALGPLREAIADYTGPFKGAASVKVYKPGAGKPQGYVKDRVVLVEDGSVPLFQNSLPARLRAETPDEVGTVVLIESSSRKVGEYTGGEPAWQTVWKVSVADVGKGRVVGRALLLGRHPPYTADIEAGENYGPPPWDELVAYLKKLPRR